MKVNNLLKKTRRKMQSSSNNPDTRLYCVDDARWLFPDLIFRYASQSSLDESSQSQFPRLLLQKPPYKNVNHPQDALDALNSMRKQKALCDVVLVVGKTEIPAHRAILSACSPYFTAMFSSFEESARDRVTLRGVDPYALQLLIDYVYTSEVQVTEQNVQSLLPASNLLQITDVRDACCEFLQTQLHPANCLGILGFADLHGCLDLVKQTENFIEQHFASVIECEEFKSVSSSLLCKIISSDGLTVPSEEKVFECVMAWVKHDLEKRKENLPALMEHVRLPLLSQEYLMQRVEQEPLLRQNLLCKDYFIEALKFHLLKGEQSTLFKTPRMKPRQPVGVPKVLIVLGGQAPKAIRTVECYDFKEEKWYQINDMPGRRCRAGVSVLDDKVYAVGGFNGSLRIRSVDAYDSTANLWVTQPSLETRRSTLGVAVLHKTIYAVGGFDGTSGLSSGEKLERDSNVWKPIASMSTRRSSVGVGVLNGLLYAVGGYDGISRECLSSVECYHPGFNRWKSVAGMSARRSGAGVGVLNNILYAVGGHDGPLVRKSVEAFDPTTETWTPVRDMNLCRRNAGVVAYNGLLYVVGGDDGTSNLASVEVYNPKSNSWTMLPASMSTGRSYAGVGIIEKP